MPETIRIAKESQGQIFNLCPFFHPIQAETAEPAWFLAAGQRRATCVQVIHFSEYRDFHMTMDSIAAARNNAMLFVFYVFSASALR